jgi:hypothetical protein
MTKKTIGLFITPSNNIVDIGDQTHPEWLFQNETALFKDIKLVDDDTCDGILEKGWYYGFTRCRAFLGTYPSLSFDGKDPIKPAVVSKVFKQLHLDSKALKFYYDYFPGNSFGGTLQDYREQYNANGWGKC